jgi:hypothetical protein
MVSFSLIKELEMIQKGDTHRARAAIFDHNPAFVIDRPASTQGRFVNTSQNARFGAAAPPGFNDRLDRGMAFHDARSDNGRMGFNE